MPQEKSCTEKSFWEINFPGHGDEIMKILDPFIDQDISFDLRGESPDVESSYRQAIFWGPVNDIIIIRPSDFNTKYPNNFWVPISFRILGKFGDVVDNNIGHWLNENFTKSQFITDLMAKLKASLIENIGPEKWQQYWDAVQVDFPRSLAGSLESSLFFACGLALSGKKENFENLLKLWLSGNLPLGFDPNGNFGVLCAD